MTVPKISCPMCLGTEVSDYHSDTMRHYSQCSNCDLVFVGPEFHLSPNDEKAYYDLHENTVDDPGYRRFLHRLFSPLIEHMAPSGKKPLTGLDFGCGSGPALAVMFEEAGHSVALYDPYYAPHVDVLSREYDFITLSEVAEHLAHPVQELDQLWHILKPGGWMGIMTKRVQNTVAFRKWHYITDPTHICFFSEKTFKWLVDRWSKKGNKATLIIVGSDVVLIQKPEL